MAHGFHLIRIESRCGELLGVLVDRPAGAAAIAGERNDVGFLGKHFAGGDEVLIVPAAANHLGAIAEFLFHVLDLDRPVTALEGRRKQPAFADDRGPFEAVQESVIDGLAGGNWRLDGCAAVRQHMDDLLLLGRR